jgi:hypothetical protein
MNAGIMPRNVQNRAQMLREISGFPAFFLVVWVARKNISWLFRCVKTSYVFCYCGFVGQLVEQRFPVLWSVCIASVSQLFSFKFEFLLF